MAINLNGTTGITTTGLTSNGIDDNATSTAMTLDTSGRVGIGETSPLGKLHIKGSNTGATASAQGNSLVLEDLENGLSILSSTAGAGYINFGDSDDNDVGMIVYDHSANALKTIVNASEAMRLDASGKLYVGKTVNSVNTAGTVISSVDGVRSAVSNDVSLILSRLNSDGNLATFYKDGSTVGSIGSVDANSIRIGKGDGNLRFYDFGSAIAVIPCNSSGANQSNVVDLGNSSSTFKDLYLSGGVYLGGTGSANKLDDYETGTWTPTFAGLTIGNGTVSGTYTKVGRQVTVVFGFACGSTTSVGTLGNITGLPFASANIWSGYIKVHGVAFDTGSRWYEAVAVLGNNSNTIFVPSITNYNSAISASNPMTWANSDTLVFTATYFTT